jgi:hypothetical protein
LGEQGVVPLNTFCTAAPTAALGTDMKKFLAFLVLLLLALGVGFSAWAVHRGFRATDEPSRLEKALARTVRNLSIPSAEKEKTNPLEKSAENFPHGVLNRNQLRSREIRNLTVEKIFLIDSRGGGLRI